MTLTEIRLFANLAGVNCETIDLETILHMDYAPCGKCKYEAYPMDVAVDPIIRNVIVI